MKRYIIGFLYWWYMVNGASLINYSLGRIVFILEYTNTLPMARNLFRPLYQDDSGVGRFMGIMIRSVWVSFGSIISLFVSVPLFIMVGVYLLLPALLGFRIVTFFI